MADHKKKTRRELSPEILLFQILPKLPAKSILRCKCVCKEWRSFLTTPMFVKIHLHHVTTQHCHEKLIFLHTGSTSTSPKFQTIGCEDGLVSTPRYSPFAAGRGSSALIISSSVNGLVCVGIGLHVDRFSDIILWNPLAGEYKTLSRPIDTKCYNMMGKTLELYHTCSDDDYKILHITSDNNVNIYSLKSDSWRKLETTLDHIQRIPYWKSGDHNNNHMLDGGDVLHFLLRLKTGYVIIRLDLKTEKFTKIQVPSICRHGCLSLKVVRARGCIELTIWKVERGEWTIEVLKMDGLDGNWTKVVTSSYSPARVNRGSLSKPLYLMRNGNWLGHARDGICKIDPEKKIKNHLSSNPDIVIYPRPLYIETFVSPNQIYINSVRPS